MNSEVILQTCVDRATNLYILHVMGVRLESIQGSVRTRIVETGDSKVFARLCASTGHQGEDGFELIDDLFRLCVCPTFNMYEQKVQFNNLSSSTEKRDFISSNNIVDRRNKQIKFLQQLHTTIRGYFNQYFSKAVGSIIRADITQVHGMPADEYFVGKILELVSTGREDAQDMSYSSEFLQSLPELQGSLKADLLKKLRFKGKSTLYSKTYVYYNNRRMRATQFRGIKGLRMRILKDAKFFNNQIKQYMKEELNRYVDRSFISENMEREITDSNEDQQMYKSILRETQGVFDLIEGKEESLENYKKVKRNKIDLAKADITRTTPIEERREILEARSEFIEAVVSAVKHKDVAKTDLQFVSRQLLRDTTQYLGGITDQDRRIFNQFVGLLQDKNNMMAVINSSDTLQILQNILENILIQNPDSVQIISDFMDGISAVSKSNKKAMAEVGQHIEILNKSIEQSSDLFNPEDFESVRELLYQRRLGKGDLDTPEILELSDSDRRSYLNNLATNYANDFSKAEEDVQRYVMGRLGTVEQLEDWRRLYKSSDPSEKAKAESMLSEYRDRLKSNLEPQRRRGRQRKSRQEVRESTSQKMLAPTNEWLSDRTKGKDAKFPYALATIPPVDAVKDALEEVRSDLSSRNITKMAKEIVAENESVFLIGGAISDGDKKTKIKTVVSKMTIEDRKAWFKKRDVLLKKIKMDAVKEIARQRSVEDLLNQDAESILIDAEVATEQDFSDMRLLSVERNIQRYSGDVDIADLNKAKDEAFRQRSVAYSVSELDRELFEYDKNNTYEADKKAWNDMVELKTNDSLKVVKAMGLSLDEDEIELLLLQSEIPSRSDTNLDVKKYEVARRKLAQSYIELAKLDYENGQDVTVKKYRESAQNRRAFRDNLKEKYRNSVSTEEIAQELSDLEVEDRVTLESNIEKALETLLNDSSNEFASARKRKIQRSQAIRSKIYSDLNEKLTEVDRNLGVQNVKSILKASNLMDMSLNDLNNLLDLTECFPTAPELKGNELMVKMYFYAVDQGLPVFADLNTGVFQTSDLKFPNDFLTANVGLSLVKQFRNGIRSLYSPRMADHIGKFGTLKADGTQIAPDNTFVESPSKLEQVLNTNQSIDPSIGAIPTSFFSGEYANLLDVIKYANARVEVTVKGDKISYTDEEGVKHSYSISAIQDKMRQTMVDRLASDFAIPKSDAEVVVDGFLNVIEKEDAGIRLGNAKRSRRMTEWLRSVTLDLGYLASVWALELSTGEEVDLDINMKCIDFMDSLASDSDKKRTSKKVKDALR